MALAVFTGDKMMPVDDKEQGLRVLEESQESARLVDISARRVLATWNGKDVIFT